MYTVEMAIERASKLGLRIYTEKSYNKAGRRVFLVTSGTQELLQHCVTHSASGLTCDCKSFEHRAMCAHIGCVVTHLRTLTPAQRTELLRPQQVTFHQKKVVEEAAKEKVVETIRVIVMKKVTTTIGASTEANLPPIFMRGGR